MSEHKESLLSYLNRQKTHPKPQVKKPSKPQPQRFTNGECLGCMYKGTSYCYNQCSINTWTKREGSF